MLLYTLFTNTSIKVASSVPILITLQLCVIIRQRTLLVYFFTVVYTSKCFIQEYLIHAKKYTLESCNRKLTHCNCNLSLKISWVSPRTKISTDVSVYCRSGCLWDLTMGEIEVATAARCCAKC